MDLFIIYPVPAMPYSTGQHCDSGASLHHVDLTGHPIGDEATIQTGRQVANRSPAGTRWPIGDGVLSRRVPGLQRGKSLKGLNSMDPDGLHQESTWSPAGFFGS